MSRDHLASQSPLPLAAISLPPSRTALLLIDVQNYDAHPQWGIGPILRETEALTAEYFYGRLCDLTIPNLRLLLDGFRRSGERVIYCQSGAALEDGSDLFPRRRARFEGADGRRTIFHRSEVEYQIVEMVKPLPGELVIHKGTVSAFNSSNIDWVLRNMGISSLVIGGVVTDGCVDSTARDASDRGYDCVIVEDACAAWSEQWHTAALEAFERYFGRVVTTREVLALLNQEARSAS